MSAVYTVKPGDTFERISRRMYGIESGASTIEQANPELSGGIVEGAVIVVPDDPNEVDVIESQSPGAVDEWLIRVSGQEFRFWRDAQLTRSIDSVSLFEFSAPFEPTNEQFRNVFRPLRFQPIDIFIGGDQVLGGTMVNVTPQFRDSRSVTASGYSKSGVMSDTTLPAGTPLEFDELTLRDIAVQIAAPYGLLPTFNAEPGRVFEYGTAIDSIAKPMQFLAKLANQRNLVIGATPKGNPLFHRTTEAPPVETLEEGSLPLQAIEPVFKAQGYFSHISSLTPSMFGGSGDHGTLVNSNLRGVVRPHTFRVDDTFGADAGVAREAKMGRMFANSVAWDVMLVGLRDSMGRLWEPNTKVRLHAHSAMIYKSTELLIRSATLYRKGSSTATKLRLVLPESFNGGTPVGFPWDL